MLALSKGFAYRWRIDIRDHLLTLTPPLRLSNLLAYRTEQLYLCRDFPRALPKRLVVLFHRQKSHQQTQFSQVPGSFVSRNAHYSTDDLHDECPTRRDQNLRNRTPPVLALQILFNLSNNLPDLEPPSLNFRERYRIDQILRSNHRAELTEVHLRNDYRFESLNNFTKVLRERI